MSDNQIISFIENVKAVDFAADINMLNELKCVTRLQCDSMSIADIAI